MFIEGKGTKQSETNEIIELWSDIPFISGYSISTYGNVKNNANSRILKYQTYKYCSISIKSKQYSIHRLVAMVFLPNPENKPTVNHIDHNKTNNHLTNLEWASYSEQTIHSPNINDISRRMIFQYNKASGDVINIFDNITLAAKYIIAEKELDVSEESAMKNISCNARKKSKSAYGFSWKYETYVIEASEEWRNIV